jgi:protein gp37
MLDRVAFTNRVVVRQDRLDLPLKTRKPTTFAVWSDLFHPDVPADFIVEAFEVMSVCSGERILTRDGYKTYPRHTFLVCTKRPERMHSVLYGPEGNFYLGGNDYIPSVWLGTTTENQEMAEKRIPELLKCRPFNLFLSAEPLLEAISIPHEWLKQIRVVVIGCESGPYVRETKQEWIDDLVNQCRQAGVRVWVKQYRKKGRICSGDLPEKRLFA